MSRLTSYRLRRALLLSASSLVMLAAASAPVLAQQAGTTSPPPPATPTPQPSASPTAEPSPAPQSGAAPDQQQQATPTAEQQKGGGTVLPTTRVARPVQKPKPKPQQQVVNNQPPAPTEEQVQAAANRQVVQQTQKFDQQLNVILPKIGTSNYDLTQRDIQELPQGNAIQFSDLALQFPGVSQDSTSSGDFHVRNEHANVQYRINGILLPDGVSGFSQLLESSFISSMQLLTGGLPAQYGLHTAGVFDITSKSGTALAGGSVSVYGGSRQTISPSFEYGGVEGKTDYFVTGRYLSTGLGLENPISSLNAIHDHSEAGRFFAYTSTVFDDPTSRVVTITGFGETRYQIPNNPGQRGNAGGFCGGPFDPANPCLNPDGTPCGQKIRTVDEPVGRSASASLPGG
jgi:hypothetical protein